MDETALLPGIKRSHDGALIHPEPTSNSPTTPDRLRKEPPCSTETSPSTAPASTLSCEAVQTTDASDSPAKKRKLTFVEKEAEKAEKLAAKEEKARLKAEEKARKEEERRLKEEEKRRKAEEKDVERAKREAERAEKDAEKAEKKRAKEAEKAKKMAENVKKEKSQMRIGAFFGRPAPESSPPLTPDKEFAKVSSRKSSVGSIDMAPALLHNKPTSHQSDFSKWILPFFPHDHTVLAPQNRFLSTGAAVSQPLDLQNQDPNTVSQPLAQRFSRRRKKDGQTVPVKTLVSLLGGDAQDSVPTCDEAAVMLSKTPYKILQFYEDVRPPYQGTYTRQVSPLSKRRLSRKPVLRALPDTDYDYDSEAEWQAPEEGDEDLDDDDEMSEDDAEADEMADFLDDENDTSKRKLLTADVEPVSTGICWEGETKLEGLSLDITAYRMDVLHDATELPINPFSSDHWTVSVKDSPSKGLLSASMTQQTSMQPPRMPLATVSLPNGTISRGVGTLQAATKQKEAAEVPLQKGKLKNVEKPVKLISDSLLPAFKAAVDGNDLNKVALVEILKKKFPSCSKDSIKGTLESVAVRQGKKEADKRWVLLP